MLADYSEEAIVNSSQLINGKVGFGIGISYLSFSKILIVLV